VLYLVFIGWQNGFVSAVHELKGHRGYIGTVQVPQVRLGVCVLVGMIPLWIENMNLPR
jgi:hypothetical protein